MEMPLITIIVPVFNIEKYISKCVKSILKQTYRNIQIILVDDGSTDKSGVICDYFSALDKRIEVIHQSNKGPVSSRKEGLKKAKGEYIGFVDGDDFIFPDMYQKLIEEIELTDADFVHSGYWINDSEKKSCYKGIVNLSASREKVLMNVVLDNGITPSIWSKLFKKDLIIKCFSQIPDECFLGEDLLNLCLCILESKKIALINDAYYYYRVRGGSLSNRNCVDDLNKIFILYKSLCNIFFTYKCYEYLENATTEFLWNNLLGYMGRICQDNFQISKYYFGDPNKLYGKKIVIYGAGKVGKDYYSQIKRYTNCTVVAWVDLYPENHHYLHIDVYDPNVLSSIDFDLLIIAVWDKQTANDIFSTLEKMGIDRAKIYWEKPKRYSLNKR